MKRFLLLIFISFCFIVRSQIVDCVDSQACNYNVDATNLGLSFNNPIVTNSIMEIGLIASIDEMNLESGDKLGAFILLEDNSFYCVGLVEYTGINTSVIVYGDDPSTFEIDGCQPNENLYFFVQRQDFNTISVVSTDLVIAEAVYNTFDELND